MDKEKKVIPTSIGGQAVIEGVMMRGKNDLAVAVRLPDGTITVDKKPIKSIMQKVPFLKLPILRGVVAFFESMVIGIQTLMYSAQFFDIEEEEGSEPSKFDLWLEKVAGDKLKDYILYFSMILS
ncbi:MAG: DUF1385 domain-containing protein, partial [Hyphomonadaceae bacterium]|nr:DUF1385 domain-containing protein [Clostridia bacterium]